MHTAADPLSFVFDFVSPYAYIAWRRVHSIAEARGREVAPVPVLLAAILNAHGHLGPAEIPAKRTYVVKDVLRKAHRAGVAPLALPPTHPFNPLLALRVATVPLAPASRRALIDALYHAAWGSGAGLETPDAVGAAVRAAGLDPDALLARANSAEVKNALRASTDDAIARGVFGVPTVLADGELFFGNDSLEALEDFLDGRDPVDPAMVARWRDLPASATRRG